MQSPSIGNTDSLIAVDAQSVSVEQQVRPRNPEYRYASLEQVLTRIAIWHRITLNTPVTRGEEMAVVD